VKNRLRELEYRVTIRFEEVSGQSEVLKYLSLISCTYFSSGPNARYVRSKQLEFLVKNAGNSSGYNVGSP
jgi:hypothetical protein